MGYSFNDKWSSFVEYFGNYNSKFSPDHNMDFGLSFLASPRLKVDLSAGSNLEDLNDTWFISSGVSYQFN